MKMNILVWYDQASFIGIFELQYFCAVYTVLIIKVAIDNIIVLYLTFYVFLV